MSKASTDGAGRAHLVADVPSRGSWRIPERQPAPPASSKAAALGIVSWAKKLGVVDVALLQDWPM